MKRNLFYALYMVVGLILWFYVPLAHSAEQVTLSNSEVPSGVTAYYQTLNTPSENSDASGTTITYLTRSWAQLSVQTVLTGSMLGKKYECGNTIFQIPNPSASNAGRETTFFGKSGLTIFMTSGSFGSSGITIWSQSTPAGIKIDDIASGTSKQYEITEGTWTRF